MDNRFVSHSGIGIEGNLFNSMVNRNHHENQENDMGLEDVQK